MEDRKVRVLLEDIDHKFKTIQEGLADIPVMKEDIRVLKEDVDIIKEDIKVIKVVLSNKVDISRVEKIEKDLKVLQHKIA